jgi:hypothetical protein
MKNYEVKAGNVRDGEVDSMTASRQASLKMQQGLGVWFLDPNIDPASVL